MGFGTHARTAATATPRALYRRYLPAETERFSHNSNASLPQHLDAHVWSKETTAVTPLGPEHARPELPETYPFGLCEEEPFRFGTSPALHRTECPHAKKERSCACS